MTDISKFIQIVESCSTKYILLEAPFWGGNSPKKAGEQKRKDFINKMENAWHEWLGMTGKEGTMTDMANFLVSKVGFSSVDAAKILGINNTPMVDGSTENTKEPEEQEAEKEESKPEEEKPVNPDSQYKPLANDHDYEGLAHNLKVAIDTKTKTDETYDNILKALDHFSSMGRSGIIPDNKIKEISDLVQDGFNVLNKSSHKISQSEEDAILYNIQKKSIKQNSQNQSQTTGTTDPSNNQNESRLYEDLLSDTVLSKSEVSDVLNDAAKFAFSNNIIGNKNYAYGNQTSNAASDVDYTTGDGYDKRSIPSVKNKVTGDLASNVWSTVQKNGLTPDQDFSVLKDLSHKDFNTLTDADKKAMSGIGWAFLRSLR